MSLPAWQGWVRSGSGFARDIHHSAPSCVEIGPAVFRLPDARQASTTSSACADGQFCIFTGYLYNRDELAGEFGLAGATCSAAEAVLAAYRRCGLRSLEKLDGSFAWAIWDQGSEQLVCARDPMGLHPFYYAAVGAGLIFSWDVDTVLAHPAVSREFHRVALAEHLVHHWWNPHDTLFRAVRRLPAGYGLTFHRGEAQLFRHWNPVPSDRPVRWTSREELEQFPALLRRAVRRTMEQGGGRAGIFLSGGLDSVSVACDAAELAAERGWSPPQALSVAFPADGDEEPIQRAVAQRLGMPQTMVRLLDYFGDGGLLGQSLRLASTSPSPPTFAYAPPFLDLLRVAKSRGCGVVLTGDGGDELLGVFPIYAADLLRAGRWMDVIRMVRMLARYWHGPFLAAVRGTVWRWGFRALARDWAWKHVPGLALRRRRQLVSRAFPSWLAPDPALRRDLVARFEQNWDRETSRGSLYATFLDTALLNPLSQIFFEEQFYRNAIVGVPTLHPYWDRPVAELLLRTQPELLTQNGEWKALVRSRVASRLQGVGFEQQKKRPIVEFPQQMLRAEGPRLWRELKHARVMGDLGIVDLRRYQAMLEKASQSKDGFSLYHLWHGAATEAWLRCRAS
jgi:asparagine synthetase B (glutamine-hydrolysing)